MTFAPAGIPSINSPAEPQFYIPAVGPASRPRRTLKHDDTFVVVDSHGDIGASAGGSDGLFNCDTRFVSHFELLVNGMQPLLLGFNARDDNTSLTIDLTNPDIYADQRLVLPKDVVHIVRTIFVFGGTVYQRVALQNYTARSIDLTLSLVFDSDFADLFEVRGLRRARRGRMRRLVPGRDQVILSYRGLDGNVRQTRFNFDPRPDELVASAASYRLHLGPKESRSLFCCVSCGNPKLPETVGFGRGARAIYRQQHLAYRRAATVTTSNPIFNEIVRRSMADLCMLSTETPQGPYPYAGIPWYSTTFGRDGLITALQTLWFDPTVARGVLRRLAAFQSGADDRASDAEPGKILHEMRAGEMAALREVPFALYYGSVDATPLFVLLAGLYAERTGDDETVRAIWPNLEAALAWIDGPADKDGDGFVEYHRATDEGLANQGWKDSFDAVFHADGRLAEGPIALAEVQGYIYAAKRALALCAARIGQGERALALEAQAERLAERFEAGFWSADLGTYAIALDGEKVPCLVRSSNAGQVLFTGIARPERAHSVAEMLLTPQFFSGWGIRTIGKHEARYNPMSYHNGSVWPHDNALIALGLARYGHQLELEQVFKGIFDAATYMDLRRLPELFCGFQRGPRRGPTLYPVACSPQAWASATPLTFLEASFGLQIHAASEDVRFMEPHLPAFLDEVIVRNLAVGRSSLDFAVRRQGTGTSVEILKRVGDVKISVVHRYPKSQPQAPIA
jgi:glycogen debranching enzyme